MKSDRVYLAVCAMPNGQNGNGGHSHNDKLSFELSIDGVDFALDPGTFCYSSSPEKRNLFRNDLVHNVIHTEHFAQNSFTGLFSNDNSSSCRLIKCDQSQLVLEVRYQDVIQYREFNICDTYVEVVDHSNVPIVEAEPLEYYSNGYGKLLKK